jgi:hypothetical protein
MVGKSRGKAVLVLNVGEGVENDAGGMGDIALARSRIWIFHPETLLIGQAQ